MDMPLEDPVRILRDLIRFRTVNPPGDEAAYIRHVRDLLQDAGIEVRMLGPSPERQNLVARLPGRGALDMKGAIAMMLASLLRLKREGRTPDGDIVLAVVCDEEKGGTHGARHLVERHPPLHRRAPCHQHVQRGSTPSPWPRSSGDRSKSCCAAREATGRCHFTAAPGRVGWNSGWSPQCHFPTSCVA
jgi:hypothetical protein